MLAPFRNFKSCRSIRETLASFPTFAMQKNGLGGKTGQAIKEKVSLSSDQEPFGSHFGPTMIRVIIYWTESTFFDDS